MAKQTKAEVAQFVRYFGPLLDALRDLGGSGTPDEVVERIAQNLSIPDSVQNDLLPSGGEAVAEASGTVDNDYRTHVLEILRKLPPAGFARLCQRLLREAGFAQVGVTGSSGDGGIDGYGTLSVNPLVSFKVSDSARG